MAATLALQILPWKHLAVILPTLSPFVAICSSLLYGEADGFAEIYARWVFSPIISVVFAGRPIQRTVIKGCLLSAKYVVLLTLGGAILGYPLFVLLDPLGIFNAFFQQDKRI